MITTDKISIIGAGNVGSLAAMRIAQENIGTVVVIDIAKGIAEGKSLDLEDCRSILQVNYKIRGTDNIKEIKDSSVVVITAGLARKPGMTREDLLLKNAQIVKEVCLNIHTLCPKAVVVIVTNPLDAMTYFALKVLGFDKRSVFGMGPTLDASRFANLIGQELRVQNTDIKATVIGSHGEAMLPFARATFVRGIALNELVDDAKLQRLITQTKERGKQIVSLLGTGSAYFAPSAAIAEIVRAILRNQKVTLGVSAYLEGEYGIKDVCIGVPCVIGRDGIEKIIELDLNQEEKNAFVASADSVRELTSLLKDV